MKPDERISITLTYKQWDALLYAADDGMAVCNTVGRQAIDEADARIEAHRDSLAAAFKEEG